MPAAGHQTVAVLSGAASVTASSYGSWIADTQQDDPVNAFDGDQGTAWAEGNELTPVGQWIQINFTGQLDLPASIGIRLLDDSTDREIARLLRVSTAAGSVTTKVAATGALQPLNVVPGRTRWLRITIVGARRVSLGYPGAGISDVLIPGVRVTRMLQPAQDPAGRQAASTVFSFHQQVPSPFAFADPAATPPMARTFTVASPAALRLQASALAVPGPGLDTLLDKIRPPGPGVLQVSVASTPGELPPGFPASLIGGSGGIPWTAETTSPVIHLSWRGQRRIASLVVRQAAGLPSTPQTVKITSPEGTRQASIGSGGLVRFTTPLTTDRIDVSFPRVRAATVVTPTGQLETLSVRLSRLSVPALAGLRAVTPDEQARFTLACGQGPALTVDGRVYQTSVSGTIGELSQYLPLQVRLCSPGGTLSFGAGRHMLTTATPGTFAVTDLSLTSIGPAPKTAAASGASRAVTIRSWQPDQRQLSIGPGAASYLEVHENYNPGWAAALNGQKLTPVRLDGWQQGFIVPTGPGGTITLSFRPTAAYHLVLAASMLAVAILLAITAWSFIGRPRRGAEQDEGEGSSPAWPRGWSLPPPAAAGASPGRPRARLAGRARRRRADFRGRRPGRARGSVACLPSLAAAAFAPGEDRTRSPPMAAHARLRRPGRVGIAVRRAAVRRWPARSFRRAGPSVRARRAGRGADTGGCRPGPAPEGRPGSGADEPGSAHHGRGGGGGKMSAASFTGIPLALLATTAYNVGLVLEKRALGLMPALDIRRVPQVIASLLTSRAWLTGFALMLTGLACQTVVLTFEPVSVVQPVLASGVVLVLVLSRLMLRERLRGGETWCVAAIAVSVVLLALSATSTEASHYASPGWMAAVMVPSVVVGLLVAVGSLRARTRKRGAPVTGVWSGVGTGLLYGVAALAIKALSGILVSHQTAVAIAIGIVSSPYLYVLAGCLAVAMLLFQAALQACPASIVVPVSGVTGSVYFIIAGTWLFHEHLPASPGRLALRLTGIALAALVLVVLSRRAPEPAPARVAGRTEMASGYPAELEAQAEVRRR